MKKIILAIAFLYAANDTPAQSFAINTDGSTADASALLDVKSNSKGILIARMNKAQKNAIVAPATGLLVFQNAPDSMGFHYYDGTKWLWLPASNSLDTIAWKTTGNTGTNITNHFIGTKDNVPLSFRQNDKWIGRLDATAKNYFIGAGSGLNSTGLNNVAIGDSVAYKSRASSAVIIGDHAGYNISNFNEGYRSVIIGDYAGDSSVANWTTIVGNLAGRRNQVWGSTFFGSSAGENNTTGYNCFIGDNSGIYNITGTSNTFIGNATGYLNNANNNTVVGSYALVNNSITDNNTAVGSFALRSNRSKANTAVGAFALRNLQGTTSPWNVAIGDSAAYNLTAGANNVVMGSWAFKDHTTGSRNTAIGNFALGEATNGDENTALGENSLANTNSNLNTGIGKNAGLTNSNGTNNTFLGAFADAGSATLTNATAIGFRSRVDNNNAMVLGSINGVNGATASTNVGIGTTNPLTTLDVNGGIRTRYSGTVIKTVTPGLNLAYVNVIPGLPAGWDFTNTMVLVSIVDGVTGTIYQVKLINPNLIEVDMNANFGGAIRFNYIIFKL
jgi:carbonic anhydrase/acetyltransferase-like protein (isoleucine patch superfamily)